MVLSWCYANHSLTRRWAVEGKSPSDISRILGIGVDCVKAHMKTAFSRLGASNRLEAVAIAIRHNLINS